MSTMPDPEDPTTVTKTFKSRKASAQASLASKDKTPKTKSKKRKVFHQKSKGLKNQDLHCVSISSTKKPKESSNKHAQTEGVTEASASCDHIARLRKDNRTAEVSSVYCTLQRQEVTFPCLKRYVIPSYSEVATLISQNECRPHFLIELFHELQLLNTDYLRQKALFALQDIVTRRVTDATDQNHDSTKPIESIGWMASNSELTPSESLATTDDVRNVYKRPNGPTCNEGDQNEGDNLSNLSTSSNFEPFATDDLGNTVIHLDQALARMREYERMKLESENNLAADSCNNLNIAATNLEGLLEGYRCNEIIFRFVALPFGLATAPRAFTKIMAALMAILRVRGLVLFPYLDDILIKAPSFAQAHESLSIVLDTLARFGWLVNRKKSCLIPSQRIIFLGMLFDTRQSRVFLPKDKRSTLCRDIRLLQGPQPPSVRP
ncbi:unnamed protein product [Ranitomeya imitator]|uniref:ribonuclease H n=1 Tax=Ranitomeya imitator TaxID=111125 RepID=A0ABN9KZ79_9NEOB|nr:unnamed protein product [Ranitomeya imitator]